MRFGRAAAILALAVATAGCVTRESKPLEPGEAGNLVQRMERTLAETLIASGLEQLQQEQPELATRFGQSRPDWNPPASASGATVARIAADLNAAVDQTQLPPRLRRDLQHLAYGKTVHDRLSGPLPPSVDPLNGPHVRLLRFLMTVQPLDTESDLEDYIARAEAIDDHVSQLIQAANIVDRETLQAQCDLLVESGADWLLEDIQARTYRNAIALPGTATGIRRRFELTFERACRTIQQAPGDAASGPQQIDYDASIFRFTSGWISASALHQSALARLDEPFNPEEMESDGEAASGQALLDQVSGAVFETESAAFSLFGREATSDLDIRLLDPASDLGSSGPGQLVRGNAVNTALLSPSLVSRFGTRTSALRLSIPGGHLIPASRIAEVVPVPPVFEGWPIYSAAAINAPEADLHLQIEAVRAAVDTGIHSRQWTRARANDFIVENTPFESAFARQMINAVIARPGSGTPAFAGYLMFVSLEEEARRQLGRQFDMTAFVDALIGEGARPYSIMKARIDSMVQAIAP